MDGTAIDVSASGMRAQRLRMELIARNLAHADTTSMAQETRTGPGGETIVRHVPFRRQVAVFAPDGKGGVTARAVDDPSPFRAESRPDHPHAVPSGSGEADAGTVYFPNVHPMVEMVDMIAATRAYEANVTAADAFKAMHAATLRLLA